MATQLAREPGMKRVVLTGSESTGKTELARQLAKHFGVACVPEFVRQYVDERKGAPLTFGDHGPIARGVMALQDEHLARGGRLLIQDTDLLSTVVYLKHYYGQAPEWIEHEASVRRPDLYLLLDIDVPWVADAQRDRGERREEMQQIFRDAVRASGVPSVTIRGSWAERFARAVEAVDALLTEVANT
jgi:NadR type nicotinamide-nucleotide adenylyltransferase